MAVESLRTVSSVPYRDGYEHVVAVATIALDPADPANAAIVDLARARRDRDGLVRFETDVVLLRAPRPRGLLYMVANRGLVTGLPYSAGIPRLAPTGDIAAGDAWVLERGLSVLWAGWQWDIERRPGTVGLDAPQALGDDGEPLRGQARLGFQPVTGQARRRLADEVLPIMGQFQALPAADRSDPAARLTERDWFNGPPRTVPRDRWRFTDPEHIELDGGFAARHHYEVTYTTSRCPVTGAGFAAARDVVAHLRDEFTHTLAFGVSQSGRWLREFIRDTGNAAQDGRRVFDGIHCHIAGGRVGEFNNRYAQPSTMNPLGFTHLPPFSPADGLLDRARERGTVPKLVFTNTATEYWRGDASLGHPDPGAPGCRWYLYAGTHHVGAQPGYVEALPVQLAGNLVDTTYLTRAHAAALDTWVTDGTEPPPSAVPRAEDGTGISRGEALAKLGAVPWLEKVTLPDEDALLGMPPLDLGPDADQGVGRYPAVVLGPARPCLVSALDEDGNERAGVRLPHVSVPLDVSSGWNPEQPRDGVPVETWNLVGGRTDLPAAEILHRYGSEASFLAQVQASAQALAAARHLLAADVDAVVADAGRRWAAAVGEG
jgi:Alpha/beta hydrolase domain